MAYRVLVALQMIGVAFLLPQDECSSEQIVKQEASLEERGNDLVWDSVGNAAPATALIIPPGDRKADEIKGRGSFFRDAHDFIVKRLFISVHSTELSGRFSAFTKYIDRY
jgi:hypothetical protein